MTDDLLAYAEAGSGPTILFIHGLTFTGQTWDPIVARLSDRFRCIALDLLNAGLRAHPLIGRSGWSRTGRYRSPAAPLINWLGGCGRPCNGEFRAV